MLGVGEGQLLLSIITSFYLLSAAQQDTDKLEQEVGWTARATPY